MKDYPAEAYMSLMRLIRDNDEGSREWLTNNHYRELVEFCDAFDGVEKSFQWLLEHGERPLAATVDALTGKDTAKVWLLQSGNRELAAFVDACDGNKTAVAWLLRFRHKGLLQLAHEIYQRNKKKEKKGFWGLLDFGNPFR